jgi:hypothetical protein
VRERDPHGALVITLTLTPGGDGERTLVRVEAVVRDPALDGRFARARAPAHPHPRARATRRRVRSGRLITSAIAVNAELATPAQTVPAFAGTAVRVEPAPQRLGPITRVARSQQENERVSGTGKLLGAAR